MKRKRYLVEQIVAAVKQHELGTPAADVARKPGIAEQTFIAGISNSVGYRQQNYSISERRGCDVTGSHRSTHRYTSIQPSQGALR